MNRPSQPPHPLFNDIRCVAFDVVGTVMFPVPSVAGIYAEFGQRFGSQLSTDEITARFRQAWQTALNTRDHRTSEMQEREFWRQLVADVLTDVAQPDECFGRLYEHFARPDVWQVYDDVADAFTTLQQRGYLLALASNFDARLDAVCAGHPVVESVSLRVISSLIGVRKPDSGFYQALTAAADCRPDQILMVGDTYDSDVAAARHSGLQAVWLDRSGTGSKDPGGAVAISRLTDLSEHLP